MGDIISMEDALLLIMISERNAYWKTFSGEFYHSMPTFLIKDHYNRANPKSETNSATVRKLLVEMAEKGLVEKCYRSRIGQVFWTLPRGKKD